MRRAATVLAVLVACLVALPARAVLRWGADAEGGAPYVFHDPAEPARLHGFEVEIAEALGRELKEPVEFKQYEYVSLLIGLERGDIDLAMNGLEVTPDRAARVRFSRPYYVYREQLVVRADDHRCDTLDACLALGGSVGTLGDTAAERLLDARSAHKKVYDGQVEPYRDLAYSRLDAVLLDLPIAVYYARPDPLLRFAELVGPPGDYAIALRKGDAVLALRVDAALARIASSGELRRILEHWNLWNDDQHRLLSPELPVPSSVAEDAQAGWSAARYLPLLLRGAGVTVMVSVLSMLLAVLLGLPIAALRLWGPRPARWLAVGYVELFRGIPVLLLLFFLYYGLPSLGVTLGPLTAAVLGFGLNYAAYEAEIYRAGIGAVPEGQWEAAASLGMSPWGTFRRVVLPQALRIVTPPMTNDFVALFKDTSLVSVIAVVELTKQYQIVAKSSLKYLEVGVATAALYLLISVPLGLLSRRLERRWAKGARP